MTLGVIITAISKIKDNAVWFIGNPNKVTIKVK